MAEKIRLYQISERLCIANEQNLLLDVDLRLNNEAIFSYGKSRKVPNDFFVPVPHLYNIGERVFIISTSRGAAFLVPAYEAAKPLLDVREVAIADVAEKLRKYRDALESYRTADKNIWDTADAKINAIKRQCDIDRASLPAVSLEAFLK